MTEEHHDELHKNIEEIAKINSVLIKSFVIHWTITLFLAVCLLRLGVFAGTAFLTICGV